MTNQKKHVFLSYCYENEAEVAQLRSDLMTDGESVWWDKADLLPGQNWELAIDEAVENAYAVILCLSRESEARATSGIYPEASAAIRAYLKYPHDKIFLIPVRLSECVIPTVMIDGTRKLKDLHYVDLFPKTERTAGVQKLLKAIRATPLHPLTGSQDRGRRASAHQPWIANPGKAIADFIGTDLIADPLIHQTALTRAHTEIMDYAREHEGFEVYANSAHTEYVLEFRAPSFAPPPLGISHPIEIDDHRVFLRLPKTFPKDGPYVSWLTPIFHPSVDSLTGEVYLGVLHDRWVDALSIGDICGILIELATFHNYPVEGPNVDASRWAATPQGQRAIQTRGGHLLQERIDAESADRRRRMNKI